MTGMSPEFRHYYQTSILELRSVHNDQSVVSNFSTATKKFFDYALRIKANGRSVMTLNYTSTATSMPSVQGQQQVDVDEDAGAKCQSDQVSGQSQRLGAGWLNASTECQCSHRGRSVKLIVNVELQIQGSRLPVSVVAIIKT